jgi:hypothetical protein
MNRKIDELLGLLEDATPPEGLKARVHGRLQAGMGDLELNGLQRLLFANPLGAAGLLSVVVSGLLRAALGSDYPAVLASFLFAR